MLSNRLTLPNELNNRHKEVFHDKQYLYSDASR